MHLDQITVLVLTWNEEANIARTLRKLEWARRVVVIDSGSQDKTLELVRGFPNAQIFSRPFDNHANQWNHGLHKLETPWVLSIDADYQVTPELVKELAILPMETAFNAFYARLLYCVEGYPLRASLLPPRIVLFKRDYARYVQDGHTQMLRAEGGVGLLHHGIWHDDRKALPRWLEAQGRYATLEARKLRMTPWRELSWADRVRTFVVIAPLAAPLYAWLIRGVLFDGRRGLYYVLQRMIAELILSLRLLERDPENL